MLTSSLIVFLVLILVQAIKMTKVLKSRFLPLVAIVLGIASGLAFSGLDLNVIIPGILTGLAAIGLWETGKGIAGK